MLPFEVGMLQCFVYMLAMMWCWNLLKYICRQASETNLSKDTVASTPSQHEVRSLNVLSHPVHADVVLKLTKCLLFEHIYCCRAWQNFCW